MNFIAVIESIILTITCFFGSVFNLPDKNVQKLIENTDGYIYGVCHPNEDYDMLNEAGLGWVRFDIPTPFDHNGNIRWEYKQFKERCKGYVDHGIKVMAVTPYPRDIISDMGFNPMDDIERTKEIAVFLYNDLKNITGAFQITNEMGIPTFTIPLTLDQAAKYIGIQLEAISKVKDDSFPIGYNSAGLSKDLHNLMKPYLKYCDYVGLDLYTGNQGNAKASDYADTVKELYRLTCKPIIIEEFGFWSEGSPKTAEQKLQILSYYGYSSEKQARDDGMNFINKLPYQFRLRLEQEHPGQEAQWSQIIFDKWSNHFYGETSAKTIENIPHTPDGQAKYFKRVMTELKKLNCLAGMIIYCCEDMQTCYFCGQDWCPFETKWGLFYIDGTPKPAYYAVKEVITGKNK